MARVVGLVGVVTMVGVVGVVTIVRMVWVVGNVRMVGVVRMKLKSNHINPALASPAKLKADIGLSV